ncbi:MAG: hypothetical protein ACRCTZ_07930 [Sarcina sp.]
MVALPYALEEYYKKRILALTHGAKIRGRNNFTGKFESEFEALANDILRVTIVHYPDEPDLTLDDAYAFMFRISNHWEPIFEEDLIEFGFVTKIVNKVKNFFNGFKDKEVLKYEECKN